MTDGSGGFRNGDCGGLCGDSRRIRDLEREFLGFVREIPLRWLETAFSSRIARFQRIKRFGNVAHYPAGRAAEITAGKMVSSPFVIFFPFWERNNDVCRKRLDSAVFRIDFAQAIDQLVVRRRQIVAVARDDTGGCREIVDRDGCRRDAMLRKIFVERVRIKGPLRMSDEQDFLRRYLRMDLDEDGFEIEV